jgi:hypothetical protein
MLVCQVDESGCRGAIANPDYPGSTPVFALAGRLIGRGMFMRVPLARPVTLRKKG